LGPTPWPLTKKTEGVLIFACRGFLLKNNIQQSQQRSYSGTDMNEKVLIGPNVPVFTLHHYFPLYGRDLFPPAKLINCLRRFHIMKTKDDILDYFRKSRERFAKQYGVKRIGLFGSIARGEAQADSDMDVLVELQNPTFDHYMDLKFELEDNLGMPVDLVLADSLKERLRTVIEQEVTYA